MKTEYFLVSWNEFVVWDNSPDPFDKCIGPYRTASEADSHRTEATDYVIAREHHESGRTINRMLNAEEELEVQSRISPSSKHSSSLPRGR